VAVRLLELGRQHPDRLVALLAQLDRPAETKVPDVEVRVVEIPAPPPPKVPGRVRVIELDRQHVQKWLGSYGDELWMRQLPDVLNVQGVAIDLRQRKVRLTVWDDSYDPVEEGMPVPVIKAV
jgi:hypothetical protein